MPSAPNVSELKIIKRIIEEGKLKTVIGKRYPLTEIVEAHNYAEKGHARANVVIIL
ncbi:MAG: zinc-binding dehydrogenase [Methanosarcinales archaeon]|nr:zinc-binding dehydrogenase [Methanosarcinales archaeon]